MTTRPGRGGQEFSGPTDSDAAQRIATRADTHTSTAARA